MKFEDLTGKRFGMLVLQKRGPNDGGHTRYHAVCDCGAKRLVRRQNLMDESQKSCGCRKRTHGLANQHGKMTTEYHVWQNARQRAKALGLPFQIKATDIELPKRCPVLGIELKRRKNCSGDSSPSLDRIIPHKGYVRGNVWVISLKANRMKGNYTLQELESLVKVLKRKLHAS